MATTMVPNAIGPAAVQAVMQNQSAQAAVQAATMAITQQQAFIINNFRGQIYISDQLDVQDTPLYDTVTYTAGGTVTPTTSAWFTNISGAGKVLAQTNMVQNGVLEAPEAFSIFSVKVGWSEGVLRADLQALVDGCAYELDLGKKPYQQGNLRHYPAGWGIWGATTKTAESIYTNSYPAAGSMNLVDIKLVIANQMSFKAFLTGFVIPGGVVLSASGTGLILINEFGGLYARGVQ